MGTMLPWPVRLGLQLRRMAGLDPTLLGGDEAMIGPAAIDEPRGPSVLRAVPLLGRTSAAEARPPVAPAPAPDDFGYASNVRTAAAMDEEERRASAPGLLERIGVEAGSPVERGVAASGAIASTMDPRRWYSAGRSFGRFLESAPEPAAPESAKPSAAAPASDFGLAANQQKAGMLDEIERASGVLDSTPAASTRSAMRAIRMPNGKLVFTNRGDAGGVEEPLDKAVQSVQRPTSSPARETLSALIRARVPVHYAEDAPKIQTFNLKKEPSLGEMAPAARGQGGGGGFYQAEGTDRAQMVRRLEDAYMGSALAGAEREEKLARMDPAERSLLENKEVGTIAYLLNRFQPEIDDAIDRAQAKVRLVRQTAADPKQQRIEIAAIEEDLSRQIKPLQDILAITRGVRPSQ